MRGDVVFRVYGCHAGREKDVYFGAFRTRAEAEAHVAELSARVMHDYHWASRHHDRGFAIREHAVEVDFEFPTRPAPRERYVARVTTTKEPYAWAVSQVEVLRRNGDGLTTVARYDRDYVALGTFEPFRQGDRDYALISRHYTATAVLDLQTGEVVAEEPIEAGGFCPVGFHVPDWWDVHDDSIIPGSEHWGEHMEWPTGAFGFVWGCAWGDDSSWKVQHLDLSRVAEGVIARDERFGYVPLATHGGPTAAIYAAGRDPPPPPPRPPFIAVWRHGRDVRVRFDVRQTHDLTSGDLEPADE